MNKMDPFVSTTNSVNVMTAMSSSSSSSSLMRKFSEKEKKRHVAKIICRVSTGATVLL